MKRSKRFFYNGVMLACSSVFLRGVGVAFNAYITKQIGAEGIGLFGLVMSVYLFATTLANSGVSLAATRLVTEELAVGCDRGIRKSMGICLLYTLFFGLLSGGVLFVFAEPLGRGLLDDVRAIRSLRALSLSMPFIALSSAMNGYFQAVRRVVKSAAVQIFEIGVKLFVTVLLLGIFLKKGIEYACFAVVLGGSVAEMASCLLLNGLYRFDLRRYQSKKECERKYFFRTVQIAVPVAVSAYLRSGLVTLEHILVPRGLKKFGASASASLAQYGVVHGMVLPLLLFPAAILSAFGGLLVPELTEFQKLKREKDINRVVSRALGLSLVFGVGASGIFFAYAHELGMAIYQSGDAGLFIRFLAPLVIVMYTDSVTDFMLKGLNQQVHSMCYNIVDSAVSVMLLYLILPRCGVNGYVAVIFVTELLNAFLSINRLIVVTGFHIDIFRNIVLPIIVSVFCSYGTKLLLGCETAPALVCCILLSVSSYLLLMLLFRRQSRLR